MTVNVRISGAICGHMWMPEVMGAILGDWSVTQQKNRLCYPDGWTKNLSDAIDSILLNDGGDFQDAKFAGDSIIIFEYRKPTDTGYIYRCFSRELSECPSIAPYVNSDAFVGDFMSED